uniref:Uncharacterized protein n=1 Tax=Arundo donax TaxID=35708 RepID=A0A0A9BH70_ARUDO
MVQLESCILKRKFLIYRSCS